MTRINLSDLTIKKVHELLQNGDLSARELLEFYAENIKKYEKDTHAFLELFDDAYQQAGRVDKQIKSGKEIPLLAGIPLAVKDNILIKNRKCSAGSRILENFTAPYDAAVISKLKNEGVVFVGRTNMDEFAMGSSTENSAFGPTKNPYDSTRVPGGSSGGSAAAVARQFCLGALGSDTGGSLRQPAAFCGVVGLKPTYGAVSRYGLIALGSSLDQIGPLAKSVEDAEIIFNVIRGKDKMDSTTVDSKIVSLCEIPRSGKNSKIKNFTLGVPKEFFELNGENKELDRGVVAAMENSIAVLNKTGCVVKQISLPAFEYAVETYYIIMSAEASSNLARYDGIKYGFSAKGENLLEVYMKSRENGLGDEPRRRVLTGTYVLSAGYYDEYYGMAQNVRNFMRAALVDKFKEVDVILSPTTPTLPFKIGEKADDPVAMYLSDIFDGGANLTGIPAMSLPAGFAKVENGKELPAGVQLMAPWFCEERLFECGKLLEISN